MSSDSTKGLTGGVERSRDERVSTSSILSIPSGPPWPFCPPTKREIMRFAPAHGVVAERSSDRVIVLDPEGLHMNTLSPVGSAVWQRLPAQASEIVDHLNAQFVDVDRSTLEADVDKFLGELLSAGLIVVTDAQG